jgi:hypothetical protein
VKGATKFTETNGTDTMIYACLNGKWVAFYVGEHGNIGNWSYPVGGIFGARPPGIVGATFGRPSTSNIGTDGKILPVTNPPTYGILSGLYDTSIWGDAQESLIEKREVVTTFSGAVIGSWGLTGSHPDLHPGPGGKGVSGIDGIPGTLSVSGSDATGPMSVTTTVRFLDSLGADLLDVNHTYSIQNDSSFLEMFRIKVEVTLVPLLGGVGTIQYGYALAAAGASTSTLASFFTATDQDAFAARSTLGDWNADMGVYEGAGEGTRVGYIHSTVESAIAQSFHNIVNSTHSLELGSGTNASFYTNNVLQSSTSNFKTDTAWRASLPSDTSGYSSYLIAPTLDVSAGDASYTFYIFTRAPQAPPTARARVWAYAY